MNFSEFKIILGAEPRSRDPGFLHARDSDPAFRAAAQKAAEFEDKLEAALLIGAPQELRQRIARIPEQPEAEAEPASRRSWRLLAAAAAVVAALGIAGVAWYESTYHWDSVDDYIVDHWTVDGEQFLELADGEPVDQVTADELFASYGMQLSPALAQRIDILGKCHTPGSSGAHMVISTDQGPVTLIFMPKVETVDGHILAFDHLLAATLQLDRGSAIVIGPSEEIIAPVFAMARDGIRPLARTG